MKCSKGRLFGGGWFGAKEMWFGGWLSWDAMRRVKPGFERRVLIVGARVRASLTAREPFYWGG